MIPDAAVCDTSVLLRFFHDHGDEEQHAAQALWDAWDRQRTELFLLDLSIYEFVNVIVRRFTFTAERAARDVGHLFDLEFEIVACDRHLAEATARTAARTGLTGYDAAFVAAALSLDVPLITGDVAILEAAPDTALPLTALT